MTGDAVAINEEAQFLLTMIEGIAYIRAFEEKALSFTQTNPPRVKGSVHLCAGQEVVPLAALAALNDDDQVVCTYRGHGWAIAAGVDPKAAMAEICHRKEGLNGGRAGSAYLMAPHTRFIGENSIVGAGTTIACGVAMANQFLNNGRIVIVTIGDGAMNQGSVHEAMAFAVIKKLPVIFIVENNGWSELTPTSEMFRVERLAQRANGYGMPSATINGTDPKVVRDSVAIAAARARAGDGPSLLECRVPRLWGHYHADIEHYRSKENRAADQARDPLSLLRAKLISSQILSAEEADDLISRQREVVEAMAEAAIAGAGPDPATARDYVLAGKTDAGHYAIREVKEMTYIQAVNTALREILESDSRAIVYGEDVGASGGIFQASRYLQREFGSDRVFDMPIAENAILGSAVGAALAGLKPIVEIMWSDFMFVALDQLVNQAANIRYVTKGQSNVPMVVRTQQGVTPGSCAQHSRSIEAILTHVPGLKVALAATAQDAYALLRTAASDPDPCVIIEARGLYPSRGEVQLADGVEPVGLARIRRTGSDVAIVTWGTMVSHALDAAGDLAVQGVEATVLDLRWLNPLDEETLEAVLLEVGGKILVVHEAVRTSGFGAELLARSQELLGNRMKITGRRLTTPDVPNPAAHELQTALLPNSASIVEAVKQLLERA
jgi:2-oxoisovalerate dehydrogenase E1 component